jgi:Flp pilus assembly protein CpaB
MEATDNSRSQVEAFRRFAGTRKGAITVAAVAAALAGIVLLVFASQYKDSVQGGNAERNALVADRLIPKGTSGDLVVSGGLFRQTQVRDSDLETGAVADGSALAGRVATRDIYPGQQITSADFVAGADPIRGQLKGTQRAIAIPLDASHGMIGQVRTGDHVDVLGGFNATNAAGAGRPEVRTLMANVLVLSAPGSDTSGKQANNSNITLRVSANDATRLAYASDNGKVWVVLRPPTGGTNPSASPATLESLLSGSPSISSGGN